MRVEDYDKNLVISSELPEEDIVWFDVKNEIFDIYGLHNPRSEKTFHRVPKEVYDKCNDGVRGLQTHTAGGRVRFKTDSPFICLKVKYWLNHMPHMAISGSSGFDLYTQKDGVHKFFKAIMPKIDDQYGYERKVDTSCELCDYILNLPLYNNVEELYLGFKKGSIVDHGEKYKIDKPIVFYGSSITQGGCASKPSTAYQGFISTRFDADFINLGFSGSAKGEPAMAEYIASLPMSAFVYDYDYNAPTDEHYKNTHEPFFKIIREKNPDLPIIIVTRPYPCSLNRIEIARRTYENAVAAGDKNVVFVDGRTLFEGDHVDCCTVDGAHPTDLGFYRMGKVIGDALEKFIK